MRDLMFAVIWMIALPISLVSPYSGVVLWVWTALLSPNDLLFGFMSGVPYNKLVAVTTLGLLMFSKQKKDIYFDTLLCLLLIFGLHASISYLTAIVQNDDVFELYLKLIKCLVLSFAISAVMTTRHRLHMLTYAFVIALSFLGVKEALLWIITAGSHAVIGNASIGDNNSVAAALVMIIPFIIYLARYSAAPLARYALWAICILTVITTMATFSRGGFIGLATIGALLIRHSRKKFLSTALIVAGALLVYYLAPESWFARLSTIKEAGEDSSFLGRVVAWKISLLIALDHPIFGGGPHAVQWTRTWLSYVPHLPSVNFVDTPPADVIAHAAHSIYFEVLGDLGFVGLFIFLTLFAVAYVQCLRIHRMTRNRPELAWAADLARASQMSIIIYLVVAAALSMAYYEFVYILLALVSRLQRTVTQEVARLSLAAPQAPVVVARPGGFIPPGAVTTRTRLG